VVSALVNWIFLTYKRCEPHQWPSELAKSCAAHRTASSTQSRGEPDQGSITGAQPEGIITTQEDTKKG